MTKGANMTTGRTVEEIDCDLLRALLRRERHTDPVSRQGISTTIDTLLDERLAASRGR